MTLDFYCSLSENVQIFLQTLKIFVFFNPVMFVSDSHPKYTYIYNHIYIKIDVRNSSKLNMQQNRILK